MLKWSKITQHRQSIASTTAQDEFGRAAKAKQEKAPGQAPPQAAYGGCHGWTVVGHMAMVAVPSPVRSVYFATFRFSGILGVIFAI